MEQTVSKKEFKGFSGNELKVFAIIAMLMAFAGLFLC